MKAITDWPRPTNVTKIISFLSLAGVTTLTPIRLEALILKISKAKRRESPLKLGKT